MRKGRPLWGHRLWGGYGTTTDFDGNFKLKLPEDVKTIRVSYVCYKPQDVAVKENMTIRIKPEAEEKSFNPRTKCKNLDLYATRDGKNYYFSQSEWESLPADEKSKYNRKGVVVIGDGLKFVVALHDSGRMTWDDAMSRYGSLLPSKEQAEAMSKQCKAIKAAIVTFGGDECSGPFWIKTEIECGSSKVFAVVFMTTGHIIPYYKTDIKRIRAVFPVPFATI